jgi:peptidoglycan hydrolase CwlO-like protein
MDLIKILSATAISLAMVIFLTLWLFSNSENKDLNKQLVEANETIRKTQRDQDELQRQYNTLNGTLKETIDKLDKANKSVAEKEKNIELLNSAQKDLSNKVSSYETQLLELQEAKKELILLKTKLETFENSSIISTQEDQLKEPLENPENSATENSPNESSPTPKNSDQSKFFLPGKSLDSNQIFSN